jgi:diguanylate cyclase (GGDEF)-like protein
MLTDKKSKPRSGSARPRVSIRTRIMILALLLIVPPMAERVRLLEHTRSDRIARAFDEVDDLARRSTLAQSQNINATRTLLQVLARAYVALSDRGQSCAAFLADLGNDLRGITSLSIVGNNERIACSTRPSAIGLDVSDRDYIQKARETGQFALSGYLVERLKDDPAIMAAYPIVGADRRIQAIIVAAVDLAWVERFARMIDQRKGASAFLLDGRGVLLAQLPGRGKSDDDAKPALPLIEAARSEKQGTMLATGLDGVRRIYAFNTLPGTDTRIVVGIDEKEALGRIDRDIAISYVQLTLFGLLAMLLAWFVGERFIIEPIRSLARTAASIGRGELDARPQPGKWTTEFAPLATALTDMAAKLAARDRELRAANRHLEELALFDGLTGLPNRRSLDVRLSSTWLAADPTEPIGLMMIDVDHFKLYNDTQGHLEGDNCLRDIGRALGSVVRGGDFVARYGGEEFVMLMPGVTTAEASEIAERARLAVGALEIVHPATTTGIVSISIGVAILTPAEAEGEQALVEAADAALYQAKRRGRNVVAVWTPPPLAKAS